MVKLKIVWHNDYETHRIVVPQSECFTSVVLEIILDLTLYIGVCYEIIATNTNALIHFRDADISVINKRAHLSGKRLDKFFLLLCHCCISYC